MEEDDSIVGSDIVLDGPADGKSRLIGKVDGYTDLAAGTGGRGCSGGGMVRGRWVVDLDCWELRVVTVIRGIHFLALFLLVSFFGFSLIKKNLTELGVCKGSRDRFRYWIGLDLTMI